MKSILKLFAGILLAACMVNVASAGQGSAEQAIAMTKKAVAYYQANGPEKAFAEFSKPEGQFHDRDLYVFVYNKDGVVQAIGSNPKMIGKSLLDMKDVDGVPFIKGLLNVAFTGERKGWFDYKWPNPATKTVQQKSSYVEGVDDVMIGCGIYK